MTDTNVAIVGAGPIGLELAIALKQAGIDYLHFDKGQVAQTITWFPRQMSFFSSNDRIAIAGMPIQTNDQAKCSREQYLAYLRSLVMAFDLQVRTFEPVTSIRRDDSGFVLTTEPARGVQQVRARRVVLATGDMDRPHRLDIDGEDLPHVSHYFDEPHRHFRQRVLIVGGKNSAAEAALRCYHAGASVILSYRREAFNPDSVKYWLLPELLGRIKRGEIECHYNTTPTRITPTHVTLESTIAGGSSVDVAADSVLLLVGYVADMSLFTMAGVELRGDELAPAHDPTTMETNVPGLYVTGTATGGSQQSYRLFIENCHIHVQRILAALTDQPPPPAPEALEQPES